MTSQHWQPWIGLDIASLLFAGLWILLLFSLTDIVVTISTFIDWFAMVALVGLLFIICVWTRVGLLGKTFLNCPQGLNLLVGSLDFKFD